MEKKFTKKNDMADRQDPRECKHYLGVARCEFQDEATLEPETTCVLYCGQKKCPDFTPKNDKK